MATLMWADLTPEEYDCQFATVTIDGLKYTGVLLWVTDRQGHMKVRLYESTLNSVAPATAEIAAKTKVVLLPSSRERR